MFDDGFNFYDGWVLRNIQLYTESSGAEVSALVDFLHIGNYWDPCWDINQDCVVDIYDVIEVSCAFGSVKGDPNWDARCDITGTMLLKPDGVVNIYDVVLMTAHFGESYPHY